MRHITPGFPENIDVPKAQAKRLASALRGKTDLSDTQSLEVIAKVHGQESWSHMRALLKNGPDTQPVTPQISTTALPEDPRDKNEICNILMSDLLSVMSIKVDNKGMFLHRALNAVQASWPRLSAGQDAQTPLPLLTRGTLRSAAKRELLHENEKLGQLLLDLILQGFDELHAVSHRESWSWRPSEMQDKLIMDGFRLTPDFSIRWGEAIDKRHALFYTDSLKNSLVDMIRSGLHVHDLSGTKDWSRLATLLGNGDEKYVLGPSGLSTLIGNRGLRMPKITPVQVVVLSLQEGLVSNVDVLLAQARSLNIHVLLYWDIGVFPALTETQRVHLMSVFSHTHRSLAHISGQGLWAHRA